MTKAFPIVSGRVAELDLNQVMAVTTLGRQLMRLEVTHNTGAPIGSIVVKAGRILTARAGEQTGQAALRTVLSAGPDAFFQILVENAVIPEAEPLGLIGDVMRMLGAQVPGPALATPGRTPVMAGSLDDFDAIALLETMSTSRQFTELQLLAQDGRTLGSVIVKAGQMLSARTEGLEGPPAVRKLLRVGGPARFAVFRLDGRSDPALARMHPIGPVAKFVLEAHTLEQYPSFKSPLAKLPSRRVRVMEGLLSEFDVPTLLQTVGVGRQHLFLEVLDGHIIAGTIEMKSGMIISAEAGSARGLPAIQQLISSPERFSFRVSRAVGELPPANALGPIANILLDVLHSAPPPPATPARSTTAQRALIMRGQVGDVTLRDMLAALGTSRQLTQLELSQAGAPVGHITLKAGRVLQAVYGSSEGSSALAQILAAPREHDFAMYRLAGPALFAEPLGTLAELLDTRGSSEDPDDATKLHDFEPLDDVTQAQAAIPLAPPPPSPKPSPPSLRFNAPSPAPAAPSPQAVPPSAEAAFAPPSASVSSPRAQAGSTGAQVASPPLQPFSSLAPRKSRVPLVIGIGAACALGIFALTRLPSPQPSETAPSGVVATEPPNAVSPGQVAPEAPTPPAPTAGTPPEAAAVAKAPAATKASDAPEETAPTPVIGATEQLTLAQRRGIRTRHVQGLLAGLGYNVGGVDNVFGPRTKKALTDFQRKQKLATAPGQVDAATVEALARESERKAMSLVQAQTLLKRAGYSPGGLDGVYSVATHTALRKFQNARGLPLTAVLDSATAAALRGLKAPQ